MPSLFLDLERIVDKYRIFYKTCSKCKELIIIYNTDVIANY